MWSNPILSAAPVAISPTPGLAYDRAKILLGRPMPVGFHRRCIEIPRGPMDGRPGGSDLP